MSFLSNPLALLGNFFPVAPYSFDTPLDPTVSRPLADTVTVASKRLAQYLSDVLLLKSQMTVQEASGPYLDLHGAEYRVKRLQNPYELDDFYRARILTRKQKLTIPAILAAVKAYYNSILPANQQPLVRVYDLQSDPARAAAANLVMFQFAIDISFQVLAADVFFATRTYLGRKSYVVNSGLIGDAPPDPFVAAEVEAVRAANTVPVWLVRRNIVTSYS